MLRKTRNSRKRMKKNESDLYTTVYKYLNTTLKYSHNMITHGGVSK